MCWDRLILPGAASAADGAPEPSLRAGPHPAPRSTPASARSWPRTGSGGALTQGLPCSWERAPFKGPWEQLALLRDKAKPRWIGLAQT